MLQPTTYISSKLLQPIHILPKAQSKFPPYIKEISQMPEKQTKQKTALPYLRVRSDLIKGMCGLLVFFSLFVCLFLHLVTGMDSEPRLSDWQWQWQVLVTAPGSQSSEVRVRQKFNRQKKQEVQQVVKETKSKEQSTHLSANDEHRVWISSFTAYKKEIIQRKSPVGVSKILMLSVCQRLKNWSRQSQKARYVKVTAKSKF